MKVTILFFTCFTNCMKVLQISQNYYSPKFGYQPEEICAVLCNGSCCDHGTVMNANLKRITDKICSSYQTIADDLKSNVLIKAPIVKWLVNSPIPQVQSLNKLANIYIDAIAREKDTNKIEQLKIELDKINKKLFERTGNSEEFVAITNPELKDATFGEVQSNSTNICMYKDHGKTNLCTIYEGIKDENNKIESRPSPCLKFGGDELPCPWHHPEKYVELYHKIKDMLARNGYVGVPKEVIQNYIAEQYNLNEVFNEKIWQPYLQSLKKT